MGLDWKEKKGELRTPLQASEQVWTVLQPVLSLHYPKQESEHYSPLLQGCTKETSVTELR